METLSLATDLSLSLGRGRQVLSGLSLTHPGGVLVVIGPNGAGKTTLLEVLAGLRKPDGGWCLSSDLSPSARVAKIGHVPQEPVHPRVTKVLDGVRYGAWLRGVPWQQTRQRAEEALAQVGLPDRAADRVGALSGGMRRRFALACSLAHAPDVLLLDEALVGLDPVVRDEIAGVIREVAGRTPVVLTTHVLSDVVSLDGWVTVLTNGKASQPRRPLELSDDPDQVSLADLDRWYRTVVRDA